jgi:hypothetical protein
VPYQTKTRAQLIKQIENWQGLAVALLSYLGPEHATNPNGSDTADCATCGGSVNFTHDSELSGGYESEIDHDADCVYIRAHAQLGITARSLMGNTPPQVLRLATKKTYGWSGKSY